MKIVLAGKFEAALVRDIDAIINPRFNASTHPYYTALNRWVPKTYSDRSGTFIALSDETIVPQADWGYGGKKEHRAELKEVDLGVDRTEAGGQEWDNDTRTFVNLLLDQKALSPDLYAHISTLSLSEYSPADKAHIMQRWAQYSRGLAEHYLQRLFLQLRAARETSAFIVVGEEDIRILKEIDQFVLSKRPLLPFVIPGAVLWVERGAARVGYVHWATSGTGYLGCVRV